MKRIIALLLLLCTVGLLAACGEPNRGEISGIAEDGIGKVVSLTAEEKAYVQEQTTNTWLEMTETEKDELVLLVGRWLEESNEYIVADYDELIAMLDRQMEQYYRHQVNEGVFETVCDMLGLLD